MLLVCFEIGADRYGIDASSVVRVLPLVPLKQVPHAPHGIAGLMSVGDTCVPVVDVSAVALGRPALVRISTRLILARQQSQGDDGRLIGLIVEKATGTIRTSAEKLTTAGLSVPAAPYLGDVVSENGALIQIVEIDRLLSDEIRAVLV